MSDKPDGPVPLSPEEIDELLDDSYVGAPDPFEPPPPDPEGPFRLPDEKGADAES